MSSLATSVCECTARKRSVFFFLVLSRVECCTNSNSESISTPPDLSLSCSQAGCHHPLLPLSLPRKKREMSRLEQDQNKREREKKNRNRRSQTATELLFCEHFKERPAKINANRRPLGEVVTAVLLRVFKNGFSQTAEVILTDT